MKAEVSQAVEELKKQFPLATVNAREDGHGGAYVVIAPVEIGSKFKPSATWMGFHIPPQYPYADIYPVFIGAEVSRANGAPFVAPITRGAPFEGRPALQISRRNGAAQAQLQKATAKILKVLYFLEKLA
ncbi:hypothetical protein B2A_06409 [mine drainage metagenome]|uniref:Uncharacterized protein n=1 Tax=mine drainage metagenome TaxID=410659 RepID=T1A7N3_9ZZZZ